MAFAFAALALAVPNAALAGDAYGDVIHVGNAKVSPPATASVSPAKGRSAGPGVAAAAAAASPPVGTKKFWPLINFNTGGPEFEEFTLRAVGAKIEIWVSDTLDFPASDCRNDGVRNVITSTQATYFSGQFDGNIHPKMSAAFSSPPARDGTGGLLEQIGVVPPGYYAGSGDKVVTLVANFQDENYDDIAFPSYVAGYHSSDINGFVNRNVMTVDSFDWAHRTGASPPNDPFTVLCESRPAQPFQYESMFAHEYQHLLEFCASPGESSWVDEGLSDYAMRGRATASALAGRRDRRGLAHPVLLRQPRVDARRSAARRAGEQPDVVGRPGRRRGALRLRRRVDDDGVPRGPVRRGLHDGAPQRGPQRPRRTPGGARPVPDGAQGRRRSCTTGWRRWRWTAR